MIFLSNKEKHEHCLSHKMYVNVDYLPWEKSWQNDITDPWLWRETTRFGNLEVKHMNGQYPIEVTLLKYRIFLAPDLRKKAPKFLVVRKLFPRARLSANMNINFKAYLQFIWFTNLGRPTKNHLKGPKSPSFSWKTK